MIHHTTEYVLTLNRSEIELVLEGLRLKFNTVGGKEEDRVIAYITRFSRLLKEGIT